MFCSNCGSNIPANYQACPNCGMAQNQVPPQRQQQLMIDNYLVGSILVTIFCCLPFGLVALIYASKVNTCLALGDIAGAQAASQSAKTWMWVGFGCGLASSLIWGAIQVMMLALV